MQLLKKRILQDGKCYEGGILKVDGFINHQMDPVLMKSIGVEFVRRFAATNVNKIIIPVTQSLGLDWWQQVCIAQTAMIRFFLLRMFLFMEMSLLLDSTCWV